MKKISKHHISIFAIVLFAFFAIASDNSATKKEDKEELMYRYVTDYVRRRLDSPDDAIFPSLSQGLNHLTHVTEEEYFIYSWVDTPGGKRINYNCKITMKKDYIGITDLEIDYENGVE